MNTLVDVLKSIACTHQFPCDVGVNPTEEERKKYSADLQAYRKAYKEATKIRVFTTSREYTGTVTKVADDYFVIDDQKYRDLRVLISKIESFDFPGPGLTA
jgi:hypothetical protein